MKHLHHLADKIILSLIGRSFVVLSSIDVRIQRELSYLPEKFILALAVDRHSPALVFKKDKQKIKYCGSHEDLSKVDLKIFFKNEEFAYQVLAAKEGIRLAFSEGKILLEGDLDFAVSFIYILEIIEAYLMAKSSADDSLEYDLDKQISRFSLFFKALLTKKEKGEI